MKDVAALIKANITSTTNGTPDYWIETDPDVDDIVWTFDEFDPRNPKLQVLFENFPEKKIWVSEAIYRIEHRCRITIFLKPTRYAEADITANKTTYFNARNEIDRILAINKFNISGIQNLELSDNGWNDKNSIRVGRGTKDMGTFLESMGGKDTAIEFRSEQIVTAIYYMPEYLELTLDSVDQDGNPLHLGEIVEDSITYTLPETHDENLHAVRTAEFTTNDSGIAFLGWGYTSNLSLNDVYANPVVFTVIGSGIGYLDAVIYAVNLEAHDDAYFKLFGEVWLAEPELTNGGSYLSTGTLNTYEHQDLVSLEEGIGTTVWIGQTFTETVGHYIQGIKLNLSNPIGDPIGDITVSIKATDSNGLPTGSILGTVTVASSSLALNATPKDVSVYFANSPYLSAGIQYAIIISCSGYGLDAGFKDSDVYATGKMIRSTDSGSTWDNTYTWGYDLRFADLG